MLPSDLLPGHHAYSHVNTARDESSIPSWTNSTRGILNGRRGKDQQRITFPKSKERMRHLGRKSQLKQSTLKSSRWACGKSGTGPLLSDIRGKKK
ncbi:hypothetical protein MLD38_015064 [Melastoma candidum]|uniref:Uncharacterized protein n=1 Tax=Melastoma candidum TaxID=119954 RepID=A0ACB9RGR4_9MYRT|nr:hypothetical protein MLD38_015064 [Melastoma candidum]